MAARVPMALPLLLVVALVALGWNLGGYRLLDPDEGRNAEVAREMSTSGDYVIPHLDGLPYLDKPVLYFAAAASVMAVLGPTEVAARLPALLATIATTALLVVVARRWWGAPAGWLAGLAFATTPLTLGYAHAAIFDSTLTLATTATILAAVTEHRTLAWGAMAVGALTKGPVALAVPAVALIPYALAVGIPLRQFFTARGLGLFLIITLPWFGVVTSRFPAFPAYVFERETLLRFATPAFHRWAPIWYYVPILAFGAFPWIFPACSRLGRWRAAWRARHDPAARESVLLAAWILGPFVFFTLDQSKLPQYVLPLVPPLALATARAMARGPRPAPRAAFAAAGSALAILTLRTSLVGRLPLTPAEGAAVGPTALVLGAALLGAAVCLALAARWRPLELQALGYALPVLCIAFGSARLMRAIGDDRSAARLAAGIAPALGPQERLLGVATFPLSLPFYLRRTMAVATTDAHELTSNYLVAFAPAFRGPTSPLEPPDRWQQTLERCPRPTVFVVAAGDTAVRSRLAGLPELVNDGHNVAFGPCRPKG